jgi:replicative DNA helicase
MDETKLIGDDKTRLSHPDEPENKKMNSSISDDLTISNQPTIESKHPGHSRTIELDSDSSREKTSTLFGKEDIRKKMQDELDDIPEIDDEDMEPAQLSHLISRPFSDRTNEERMKINRNFLRDAEPFSVERLVEDLKSAPDGLATGFNTLDQRLSIPQHKLTFIAGRPGHGKTLFMLNIFLNMCRIYPDKHFLYYTYGEPKNDIEIKLINISGEKPFNTTPSVENGTAVTANFNRWKQEFQSHEVSVLLEKAETNPEYSGLKQFLDISPRVHVIDSSYNISDLLDSIRAFNNTLPVGAVFIDHLQAIRPNTSQRTLTRAQLVQEISDQLVLMANHTTFPIICSTQFAMAEKKIPEYDELSLENLKECGDPQQAADLIIGLQNYLKSEYIGSNSDANFKSRFYEQPLNKAEPMPNTFKGNRPYTVLLVKVLSNRNGAEAEWEMLYNKWLMKIGDSKEQKEHPPVNKK